MKKITTISISIIVLLIVIFQACKDEELPKPKNTQTNKIELTITEDSTSYVFSELTCSLNQQANFEIKQYGFCRDTVANVNIKNTNNSFENLISQNFTKNVEVLLPNKTYYVKAYIQTGNVIIYSNEITIQTLDARPIVTTRNITNIIANSALSGGEAEAYDTLFPITQRGVCWAKTTKPTIKDSLTTDGTGNGTFTSQIKNLDIGTKYYIRAYAINSEGISYGEEKIFETLDGIPNLTTDSIADVTPTSATFYGNIIENDGLKILEKGFCWNTSTNPTIDNNIVKIPGDTLGSFSKNITNLDVNTIYYVKAYIKNKAGTFYGDEINFTTADGLPNGITTTEITDITAITATGGGSVTNNGGFTITARGVCWSINENPTITDANTTNGLSTGSFTSTLTGLTGSTTYYVRAYATNINGTAYGNQLNFTTEDGMSSVTTVNITNIKATSAISGGNINDDGGAPITERGVCWNTTQNPTTDNYYISSESGIGNFISNLTNLNPNTKFYVRAYAINAIGTIYGNELNFTTDDGIPTLTTTGFSNITATTASSGGNITNNGGSSITARGICWSTNSNPTINNNKTTNETGTGGFTSNLTDLNPNTTYYVKAYATNSLNTTYGDEKSFTTKTGIPILTTTAITNITAKTATSGGNITDDGGFSVISRGVCISTLQNPTISDSHTSDGTGTGIYVSELVELDVNTTYYVRAYTTNSIETTYGNEFSFTTDDGIPTLTTTIISNITAKYANSGGSITDDGGAPISERGICWSISQNPTTSNSFVSNGLGTGSFNANLTGLNANTTYYVRAYAINAIGTTYGNELSFTTDDGIPTFSTIDISNITANSAESGCSITDDGGLAITELGVCWSTNSNPNINNYKTIDGNEIGSFTSFINSLEELTTYYVKSYVTNETGSFYGNEISFTTFGTLADFDGNTYKSVKIGNQIWMAENLKVTHYPNGGTNTNISYYKDSLVNLETYGALYTWYVAMHGALGSDEIPSGVQGVCPDGWHLPSYSEWQELNGYLSPDTGGKLKEEGTIHWNSPNTGATNETGFRGLPGGYLSCFGSYSYLGKRAMFWSSTDYESDNSIANNKSLHYDSSGIGGGAASKESKLSIRCIKD